MPRLEIELTSRLPDGDWTWRAAGARQPKGLVAPDLVPQDASVGDVLRADTQMGIDGISVVGLTPRKTKRPDADRLEVIGRPAPPPPDYSKSTGAARERRARPPRDGDRPTRPRGERAGGEQVRGEQVRGDRTRGDRTRGERAGGERTDRAVAGRGPADRPGPQRAEGRGPRRGGPGPERSRGPGSERTAHPGTDRPAPRKLQPGRAHRERMLAALAAEQVPVAEQLMRGGLPAVRKAVADQNAQARAAGVPEINPDALLTMAEQLLPALRVAEWRDRADAILAGADWVGLRDLRSVVAGAESIARDAESREILGRLQALLDKRGAEEKAVWEAEIATCLDGGRVLRALRVSARSPEPGARFPAELAQRLSEAAGTAMSAEVPPDRWGALLDAVVASPVRRVVKPQALPPEPPKPLVSAALQAVGRVPGLAPLVGTTVPAPPPPPSRRPPPAPAAAPSAEAPSPAASGDDGDDPVLVEELSQTVHQP